MNKSKETQSKVKRRKLCQGTLHGFFSANPVTTNNSEPAETEPATATQAQPTATGSDSVSESENDNHNDNNNVNATGNSDPVTEFGECNPAS
jgi:hypothetical protein